ncbi:hexosaminidase D-like [Pelobates fuscus]|uniref:hexosaminidase D-like n=1 Tax=Pelobates fuscus TaxID=191477 RepID=UPI002FE47EA0
MPPQRRIYLLRLGVLIILGVVFIKYKSKSSSHHEEGIVYADKMEAGWFWGQDDTNKKEEKREPPQEPVVKITVKKDPINKKDEKKDLIQMKLVHLDLKGAAPRITYFEQLFPLLSKLGANGLLIEYEDMFPFSGELEVLKSAYAYSEADIDKILKLAKMNKLEVVPLVQTFGHMEYVLKHDKFRGLREVERYPNSLNPHHAESLPLVKSILTQVLEKHPTCNWIHIGADEVYHLGEGQDSKAWLNDNQGNLGKMFVTFIKGVVGFLHEHFPEKEQLMWDDMLRKLKVDVIQASGIATHVSPVLWIYNSAFSSDLAESHISKYQEIGFKSIWFASAFKGASGVDKLLTPINMHAKNHIQWKQIIDTMPSKFSKIRYAGIALTGWQRYDHYSVLCELLPVGIPSLAVCLQILQRGEFNEEAKKEITSMLGFNTINVETNICEGNGAFPGSDIYNMVQKIHNELKQNVRELTDGNDLIRGWFSPYHRKHKFGNPHRMETFSAKLTKTHEDWENLIQALRTQLESIYFPDTVEEWMEENVNPQFDLVSGMAKDFQDILPLYAKPKDAPKL